MKKLRVFLVFLSCMIFFGRTAEAMDKDILLGLNTDVASFGIEKIIPGVAFFIWPWVNRIIVPGIDGELYLGLDRFEFSSHLYLRAGLSTFFPFAGVGIIFLKGDYFGQILGNWYPEVQFGCRIALPRFPTLYPILSVRIKKNDTDSNILTLGGWSF